MALNYVEQVARLFRTYAQEPRDLSEQEMWIYLEQGYEDFRNFVSRIDPSIFMVRLAVTPVGESADLAGVVFGAIVTQRRLTRLVRVGYSTDGLVFQALLHPASSIEELQAGSGRFMLDGQSLRFSGSMSGQVLLEYIPQSNVDWTKTASGNTEWIDDLIQFHDVIALYALRHYYIHDEAENAPALNSLARREQDLSNYIQSRNIGASQSVADVRGDYDY